jgi:excinuclease ABC subunit B
VPPLPARRLGKSERPTEISVLRQGLNLFAPTERKMLLKALAKEMSDHADRLEYEAAAAIRDEIAEIRRQYGT